MSLVLFELRGVQFAHHGRPPVFTGADLTLCAGERLGLIGPNGSGKTTLLHLMVGLLRRRGGELVAFGRPRRIEEDFREVRTRAGLLFQDPDDQLFCPTVLEDVAFGPLNLGHARAAAAAMARRTLDALGLHGFEHRITYQLSGGEKRLVALASVLAMEPDVLLLDEPSTGLDESAERRLLDTLKALPQAMVLVSHDPAFLDRLVTRRIRIADGRLEPA